VSVNPAGPRRVKVDTFALFSTKAWTAEPSSPLCLDSNNGDWRAYGFWSERNSRPNDPFSSTLLSDIQILGDRGSGLYGVCVSSRIIADGFNAVPGSYYVKFKFISIHRVYCNFFNDKFRLTVYDSSKDIAEKVVFASDPFFICFGLSVAFLREEHIKARANSFSKFSHSYVHASIAKQTFSGNPPKIPKWSTAHYDYAVHGKEHVFDVLKFADSSRTVSSSPQTISSNDNPRISPKYKRATWRGRRKQTERTLRLSTASTETY
jgi:hypothetical protein